MGRDFQAYVEPLDMVTLFKYLGRVMTAGINDWPEVVVNLRKARKSMARMTRILVWEGADLRVSRIFFKALVKAVLIFGSEMWVLNPRMEQALSSFHHRVARRIIGRKLRRWGEGGWDYPPLESAIEEAGSEEIGVYIQKMQNMVAQYIATQPILDLCEQAVQRPAAWVSWRWWDQEGLKLGGARERATAATDGEEEIHGEKAEREEKTGRR